jgi:FkbM family methyltransferase
MEDIISIQSMLDVLDDKPSFLFNIGVGQLPHNEAAQFKRRFPEIKVVGVEPQTASYMEQKDNYCGTLLPIGITDKPGIYKLYLTEDKGNSSLLKKLDSFRPKVIGHEMIYCTPLDRLDEACGHPDNVFLWMDIEGNEFNALRGGEDLLFSGRLKWIMLELTRQCRREGDDNRPEILDLLEKAGFEVHSSYDSCRYYDNILFKWRSKDAD